MAPDKKSVLNIERPRNPFMPTNEPDWEATRATARRNPALNYDYRKDRKSYDLSPVSDWNDPLPPGNSSGLLREEVELRETESRRSSQSPAMSKSPNVIRKTAPPIPKKPALLSNPYNSREGKVDDQGKSASMSLTGGQNVFDDEVKRTFPPSPPPGRNRQQKQDRRRGKGSDGPPPSPRDIGTIVSASSALMDDEIEGANTIPSLQPVCRRQL